MVQGITDPTTGKTYIYTGFAPLSRVTDACNYDDHGSCKSAHQDLIKDFNFEFTKAVCCLCKCHFEGGN